MNRFFPLSGTPSRRTALCGKERPVSFVGSWNNCFTPALLLTDAELKTLPLWTACLRSAGFTKFDMGRLYMMIALSILPVVAVYLLLSKFIARGVTMGSVKG